MGFPGPDSWNEHRALARAFVIQVLITIDSISFYAEDGVSIRPPIGILRQLVREPDTRNTPFTVSVRPERAAFSPFRWLVERQKRAVDKSVSLFLIFAVSFMKIIAHHDGIHVAKSLLAERRLIADNSIVFSLLQVAAEICQILRCVLKKGRKSEERNVDILAFPFQEFIVELVE